MSRSRKKHPIIKDHGLGRNQKRTANKRVRKMKDNLTNKGNSYRKVSESWDIHDMCVYSSKKDFLENWEKQYNTLQEAEIAYERYYCRK